MFLNTLAANIIIITKVQTLTNVSLKAFVKILSAKLSISPATAQPTKRRWCSVMFPSKSITEMSQSTHQAF